MPYLSMDGHVGLQHVFIPGPQADGPLPLSDVSKNVIVSSYVEDGKAVIISVQIR
jgi:hypothetical protein